MRTNQIPFERQKRLEVLFRGRPLDKTFTVDFLADDNVIVELKAIKKLTELEEAILLNYLKASKRKVGLLLNFGSLSLEYKRRIL